MEPGADRALIFAGEVSVSHHPGVSATGLLVLQDRSGSASRNSSRDDELFADVLRVDERGLAPVTVTVSSSAPTFMSAFTVAVNPDVSSMPSRLNVLKPGSVKVTV